MWWWKNLRWWVENRAKIVAKSYENHDRGQQDSDNVDGEIGQEVRNRKWEWDKWRTLSLPLVEFYFMTKKFCLLWVSRIDFPLFFFFIYMKLCLGVHVKRNLFASFFFYTSLQIALRTGHTKCHVNIRYSILKKIIGSFSIVDKIELIRSAF